MTAAEEKYSDIIDKPHHRSEKHPHMAAIDRAAQFSPFAALTGFDSQIDEAARFTDSDVQLDESQKDLIRMALSDASDMISAGTNPAVSVSYFVRDKQKDGGELVRIRGTVRKIDSFRRRIYLSDGTQIPIDDVRSFVL